jgi:hypothetical protein
MLQKMSSKKSRPSYTRYLHAHTILTSFAKKAPELDLLYYQRLVEAGQA